MGDVRCRGLAISPKTKTEIIKSFLLLFFKKEVLFDGLGCGLSDGARLDVHAFIAFARAGLAS
jgi:hypothetical protein